MPIGATRSRSPGPRSLSPRTDSARTQTTTSRIRTEKIWLRRTAREEYPQTERSTLDVEEQGATSRSLSADVSSAPTCNGIQEPPPDIWVMVQHRTQSPGAPSRIQSQKPRPTSSESQI